MTSREQPDTVRLRHGVDFRDQASAQRYEELLAEAQAVVDERRLVRMRDEAREVVRSLR